MINRIKELIEILNNASFNYYNSNPIMSDCEWDKLYDELKLLEQETNIVYSNSPTQNVGYKVLDKIEKVTHNHPMLSLDKCHSEKDLIDFANDKDCILSVKCDGLTTSLHYINGKLIGAESRGNGIEGGDILENVMTIKNIPHNIPYKEELIIDGETIIDWNTFNKINECLPIGQDKFKHPRNLASASLNVLDTKIAASRNMRFIAWRVIKGLNCKSVFFSLKEAEKLGFEIVPMWTYTNKSSDKENISVMLSDLQDKADNLGIPYDGAVMAYDDIEYGKSLGRTEKFFRHSIAYKYEDKLYETKLKDIGWNTSKTGLINPVAVFDPVDLNGAITTRATLHNVSYIENLQLGIGDKIQVYRANMVIPKVHSNLTRSNAWKLPDKCPCCGGDVEIHNENGSKTLHCMNPDCKAKLLGKLVHFVSKNAINIDGLSEQTLQKFIDIGWLNSFKDIYYLSEHKEEMYKLDGFGKKSVDKLLESIEKSRNTTLDRLIYGLCIPLIGRTASKTVAENFLLNEFYDMLLHCHNYNFTKLNDFGEATINSMQNFIKDNYVWIVELIIEFNISDSNNNVKQTLKDNIFVITGSLNHYKNRDELVSMIEKNGGKVSSSVSTKTSYLINNDITSNSGKNRKANELNIPIISEEDFIQMIS